MSRLRKRVELRYDNPNDPNTLDEIVMKNAEFVHFERMSDTAIWCSIDVGGDVFHLWIQSKNRKSHIGFTLTSVDDNRELKAKPRRKS